MPSRKFKLRPDGRERLELRWTGSFANTEVLLDGAVLHTFVDRAALTRGERIETPKGKELFVQYVGGLAITYNVTHQRHRGANRARLWQATPLQNPGGRPAIGNHGEEVAEI